MSFLNTSAWHGHQHSSPSPGPNPDANHTPPTATPTQLQPTLDPGTIAFPPYPPLGVTAKFLNSLLSCLPPALSPSSFSV